MRTRIPDDMIEQVRRSIDIVDLIGEYIPLKKQGRNFFGLCPFHGEKTPSLSVSPDKQIFHCFGCKAGGNVYTFLMDMEGWSFLETVHHLGEKGGVDLSAYVQSTRSDEQLNVRLKMIKMHELLAKLYHYCLLETDYGEKARTYLRDRSINKKAIKQFKIGFSPNSWEFATNFLVRRGFPVAQAEQAGLLSKREFDEKVYDRFRNRIMFPIHNAKGEVVAFGGRIVTKSEPKYLNSPETTIFSKGRLLYGFHISRTNIRRQQQAILFEGYVDVVSAWQAGIMNTVATLGTALTAEQARRLRSTSDSVVICYDSDEAGHQAALRSAETLEIAGCYVKIAELPDGYDPDDYIRRYGRDQFLSHVIAPAATVMTFKMNALRQGKNLQDEGERMRFVEEVLREISRLPKAIERDHYLRLIAEEFSFSLDALKQQQFQYYLQEKKNQNKDFKLRDANAEKSLARNRLLPAYKNAERYLISYMLKDRDVALQVQERIGGFFHVEEHSALAAYLYAFYAESDQPNVSAFLETIEEQQLTQLASELAMQQINEELSDAELQDYINVVLNYPRWLDIEEKEKEKSAAEEREDFMTAAQIASEIIAMKKELNKDE